MDLWKAYVSAAKSGTKTGNAYYCKRIFLQDGDGFMGAVAYNTAILILLLSERYEYQIAQHLFYQPSGKPNVIFLINKSRFQKNQTPKVLSWQ